MNTLLKVITSEDGGTVMEQGIMVALFAVIILGVVSTLGLVISNTFTNISDLITAALRLELNFLVPEFDRTP